MSIKQTQTKSRIYNKVNTKQEWIFKNKEILVNLNVLSNLKYPDLAVCFNLELWNSQQSKVGIRDIANRYGFWHMGQFAADYKKLFGELLSKTK